MKSIVLKTTCMTIINIIMGILPNFVAMSIAPLVSSFDWDFVPCYGHIIQNEKPACNSS